MKRTAIILLLAAMLFIPIASAFTIIGPTNFIGPHGGIVRFDDVTQATQFSIVNNINDFTQIRTGGRNYGGLAFDAQTGVNMTILEISRSRIRYNVSTLAVGEVTTYVMYGHFNVAPTGINTAAIVYDPVTNIASVNTTGNGVIVTLNYYADVTAPIIDASSVIWILFPLLVLLLGVKALIDRTISLQTFITIIVVATVMVFFAYVFGLWGY